MNRETPEQQARLSREFELHPATPGQSSEDWLTWRSKVLEGKSEEDAWAEVWGNGPSGGLVSGFDSGGGGETDFVFKQENNEDELDGMFDMNMYQAGESPDRGCAEVSTTISRWVICCGSARKLSYRASWSLREIPIRHMKCYPFIETARLSWPPVLVSHGVYPVSTPISTICSLSGDTHALQPNVT